MSVAMASAVCFTVGTALHLTVSVVDRSGRDVESRVVLSVLDWFVPMGWAALLVGSVCAVLAAA
ncbi:hypothetical protein QE405_001179 [Nocardioides zeae]|uniref:Uncharacterized protein n=1 Tax=Nocardioides zeae TaxID=1457234 RepID=A0AAJ1TXN2_9ACTN|nr:hypothetical protein [Nocardioides zeae]